MILLTDVTFSDSWVTARGGGVTKPRRDLKTATMADLTGSDLERHQIRAVDPRLVPGLRAEWHP
jgi:hypothetical protein